jgi:aminopeptidase
MNYPSKEILKKYADVLIKFALWGGEGIKKGDSVFLQVPESAKAMLPFLEQSVLEAGGHPWIHFTPDGMDRRSYSTRSFLEYADEEQLRYVPKGYLKARVEDFTHFVSILADSDPQALKGIDSKKMMSRGQAMKYYYDERNKKEDDGQLTWTLALFGTEGMAKEAGLSIQEYWSEIIKACFLDLDDPISKWSEVTSQIADIKTWLDGLKMEKVEVKGDDVDLEVKLGPDRQWLGGSGRNIPSFELFISPDWRGTNGWIRFNQPLYRYGNLIKGIELEFKDGVVVKASAKENEQVLLDMIAVENADKAGEFSLTDKKFSRITKFMANTLFDENVGGEFGNTHIALGNAYHDSYPGDIKSVSKDQWDEMGYNESAVHTDIISTTNRTVTATLPDGSKKVIYKDGEFVR